MSVLFQICISVRGILTIARCTQAVVWCQVTALHEHLSAVEGQGHWVQGTLPVPGELLQILVVSANKSPPIHGMYYSRRSSACIQAMGAGHSVFAAGARPEMQGMSMVSRVVRGVYAEARHMTGSGAHSTSVLCRHTVNEERLAVHNSGVSMALLSEMECMDCCGALASQEVLPVCNML